jgi:excisionase family DNA binding protein
MQTTETTAVQKHPKGITRPAQRHAARIAEFDSLSPTRLVSVTVAAAVLDVHHDTIWKMLRDKRLPRIKLGSQSTRIPVAAIREILQGKVR